MSRGYFQIANFDHKPNKRVKIAPVGRSDAQTTRAVYPIRSMSVFTGYSDH